MNQTSVIGPKIRPTLAVPFFWKKKSVKMMISVSGIANLPRNGSTTARPSVALRTEIAGVMIPSP